MSQYHSPSRQVVHQASPLVYAKVCLLEQKFPQLGGRALRAGFLAAGGAVKPSPQDPDTAYLVASSAGSGQYLVQTDSEGLLRRATCTCPDFKKGQTRHFHGAPSFLGGPKCKHIVAVAILRLIEQGGDSLPDGENPQLMALQDAPLPSRPSWNWRTWEYAGINR